MTAFNIDRAAGIGGSDVPAILGISPWASPLDVWLEKVKHPSWRPKAQTPEMRFGTLLEPVLRAAYEEDTGRKVYAPGVRTFWATDGIRYAHLDGMVEGDGIWEGKAPFQTYRNWHDGPPVYVLAQVQHYLAITEEPWCDVSALAAGLDPIFQTHRVPADPATQANIEAAVMRFWHENVLPKNPPAELPAILEYPTHAGNLTIVADEDAERDVEELFGIKAEGSMRSEDEDEIKERLKRKIGSAAGMTGRGWRIRYKSTKDRETTDWKLVAQAYRSLLDQVETMTIDGGVVDLLQQRPASAILSLYTTTSPGTRPFVLETQEDK